jgi:hypothetical protein
MFVIKLGWYKNNDFKDAINIPFLFQMNKKHIQKCLLMNKKGKNESLITPLNDFIIIIITVLKHLINSFKEIICF